ncbi:DUF6011 domain-containing protein [Streptomyces sp. NPDC006739]|uniref:DUF6011 domain-containing protein n=1 Tax=Streptomyces sp. NPDC006739 TaxID=3364763 RepID=UPI00368BF637
MDVTAPPAEEEPVRCTCGHLLTDDLSRSRKLGPVCWRKLHGRPVRQPRRPTPAATPPGPGQAELPLDDQLPLWSPT